MSATWGAILDDATASNNAINHDIFPSPFRAHHGLGKGLSFWSLTCTYPYNRYYKVILF